MNQKRPVYSTANLLAYLEATSQGWSDVGEDERLRALEAVEEVTRAESRKWRARRRPSPGRSRAVRGFSVVLLIALQGQLAIPAKAEAFLLSAFNVLGAEVSHVFGANPRT
jgi:hypothetical protein